MDIATEILFTDPVLQRIFFDGRRFAPRSKQVAGEVAGLDMRISDWKVPFQKSKEMAIAEYWQRQMRRDWFAMRDLCAGYFIKMPGGYDDGYEHVMEFRHDNADPSLQIDFKKRAALWHRYERRPPPAWRRTRRRMRRRRSPL